MNTDQQTTSEACHKSIIIVVLLIVSIVSVSGFFMGIRQKDADDKNGWVDAEAHSELHSTEIKTAPRYSDISDCGWKANSDWDNSLEKLSRQSDLSSETAKLTDEERAEIILRRTERRAYDGAPPVIPHAIQSRDVKSCVACHDQGANVKVAGKVVPMMSHPYLTNCTQCHAPSEGRNFLKSEKHSGLKVKSSFKGIPTAGKGTRAYHGAPPTMPHKVAMRQNCASCHGAGMPNAVKTSHPHRKNCLQCHAPNATLDNAERFKFKSLFKK